MTIGVCPFATQEIIPPGPNDPAIMPRMVILHVDGGNSADLHDFFNGPSGGIESHFHVTKTGQAFQYRNIFDQADANLDANDFAVSIETQGFGSGEWTPEQLATIKRLIVWAHNETDSDIPLQVTSTWDGEGVGYHTMFGAPSHWTPVAKTCPGPDRINQFHDIIEPWLKEVATVRNLTDDDITAILERLGEARIQSPVDPTVTWSLNRWCKAIYDTVHRIEDK